MESPSGSHSTFVAALQPLFGGEGQPSGVQSHGSVADVERAERNSSRSAARAAMLQLVDSELLTFSCG